MPARSFIGEAEHAARRFYATVLRGEVSDENVRAYLRAASQIEDIWSQIDARLAELQRQGVTPWEAYSRLGYALAFIRAARTCQVFVRELLGADVASDIATEGFLPRVTYDQANALCHHIQPNIQRAVAALNDSAYEPDVDLPLKLSPRVEAEDGACPITHLQGMIAAAREVREWAAGLIAQYGNALHAANAPVPEEVGAHLTALQSRLAQADSTLRFGTDLVGQAFSQGHANAELHEQAEDALWQALADFFLLNQAVALPQLLVAPLEHQRRGTATSHNEKPAKPHYEERRIHPHDLWRIAAPSARAELMGTTFGTDEMNELCRKMGHKLSAQAREYLDQSEYAVEHDYAYPIAAMANCPFEPLYRARRNLTIVGTHISAGHEFHYDFHRGRIETKAHFTRVNDWQECQE